MVQENDNHNRHVISIYIPNETHAKTCIAIILGIYVVNIKVFGNIQYLNRVSVQMACYRPNLVSNVLANK
jgi:hypothetical protein